MVNTTKPMALIGKKQRDLLMSKSEDVPAIDSEIIDLAGRMVATCRAKNGYAIAAIQVGVPLNLVALRNGDVYFNVYVSPVERETEDDLEGCLSLPGKGFVVPRYKTIDLDAMLLSGEEVSEQFSGFEARMWQHEYDHINGILIDTFGTPAKVVIP